MGVPGSTIYGPYTLDAYIQEFTNLAAALAQGITVRIACTVTLCFKHPQPPPGPSPPNLYPYLFGAPAG